MFDRLASFALRRRRIVLVAAVVWVGLAGALGGPVAGLLSAGPGSFEDDSSEAVVAADKLEDAGGVEASFAIVALVDAGTDVRQGAGRQRVEEVSEALRDDPAVGEVFTYESARDPAFVSRDGTKTYIVASYRLLSETEREDATDRIIERFEDDEGVTLGGEAIASKQIDKQVENDLRRAETVAFPILFLVSLWVFRGVIAALLPLLIGGFTIMSTFLAMRIVDTAVPLSIFALNLVIAIGLGLAIDYSLFVVSRYREELANGLSPSDAIRRTMATGGRTVFFSALTVAAALASMLLFPQQFLYSMGIGGILVALISGVAALVVLPAILVALGPRVNSLAPARWKRARERAERAERSGFWYRLSETVMRRPVAFASASTALLLLFGLPALGIDFIDVDERVLPESASARVVGEALDTEFVAARTSPSIVVVEAPRSAGAVVADYAPRLDDLPGAAAVSDPRPVGDDVWRIDVISESDPLSEESRELVRSIRDLDAPFETSVAGQTAQFLDQERSLGGRLPVALVVLMLTTVVLLFLMTGSILLPIKTFVMNILTLFATFGILAFVFVEGNLEGLLDFQSLGALDMTQPILIGFVAFALSTDYGVFLLTRIKEAYDAGASNTEAVAAGLQRTGRLVTSAALLFCIALAAFSSSEIVFIKTIGVGAVVAVLLDATIVRALLVPSLMRLLGDRNWWAPEPLRRLHRRIGLSESG